MYCRALSFKGKKRFIAFPVFLTFPDEEVKLYGKV